MIPGQNPNAERPSKEYAPQSIYRSYLPESVFQDAKTYNTEFTSHERLSHQEVIARANGGVTNLDSMVDSTDQYQSDGK